MIPNPAPLLVQACRHERLARPPVWLMRQAGRYLPEYRAVREKVSFLTLCKTPELAAEVSLQPFWRFRPDGVIMFCDILVPVEAMGMVLDFPEKGPHLAHPIRSIADIQRLIIPDPVEKTGFVITLLSQLRQALANEPDVALIGFAGAPWTLAAYMIEGGVSKNYIHLKQMMWNEPQALHQLLAKIAETITQYLQAQVEAGAQVLQLFDSWAGILEARDYREFVLPYHQQIILGVKAKYPEIPMVLYVNGSRGLLEEMRMSGADVVSIDSLTSIPEAKAVLGKHCALQGNLDPTALFTRPETLKPMVDAMIKAGGEQGYIANLGHGVLPKTPINNVQLLVETVKTTTFREKAVSLSMEG